MTRFNNKSELNLIFTILSPKYLIHVKEIIFVENFIYVFFTEKTYRIGSSSFLSEQYFYGLKIKEYLFYFRLSLDLIFE